MSEKYTRDRISETVDNVLKEASLNVTEQYKETLDTLSENSDINLNENHVAREVAAIILAQNNTIDIMKEVIYRLLNDWFE